MDNNNQPAFPVVENNIRDGHSFMELHYKGLSKREYFAGLAMQSLISTKGLTTFDAIKNTEGVASDVVDASYAMADLMLNNK